MKWPAIISVLVAIVITVVWAVLFQSSDKRPAMMASLAGCYLSTESERIDKIDITPSGDFRYKGKSTSIVPYEDKQSLSFLPKMKIVVGPNRSLEFMTGSPLLLRIDADHQGFIVPSENNEALRFRRGDC